MEHILSMETEKFVHGYGKAVPLEESFFSQSSEGKDSWTQQEQGLDMGGTTSPAPSRGLEKNSKLTDLEYLYTCS